MSKKSKKAQKAIQKMNTKGVSDDHEGRMTNGSSHWHSERQEASSKIRFGMNR
jgi:hypothetical protein